MAWLARLWVVSACLGWWPGTWVAWATGWWWTALSLLVCVMALRVPARHRLLDPVWLWGVAVGPVAVWTLRDLSTLFWATVLTLIGLAGWLLCERGFRAQLREGVILSAWVALAWWGLAHWHLLDYPLGRRAVLGTVLGMASLWSSGAQAWVFVGMSGLTGSWTGAVIPLVRLLPIRWWMPNAWLLSGGALVATFRWWGPRLAPRWAVWSHLGWIKTHWLTGWGRGMIPGGFQDAVTVGGTEVLAPLRDLHNTWLDTLARGGVIGLVGLLVVMAWAFRQSLRQTGGSGWRWLFAVWVMTWQSVGASPALMCLGLVWLFSLCDLKEV